MPSNLQRFEPSSLLVVRMFSGHGVLSFAAEPEAGREVFLRRNAPVSFARQASTRVGLASGTRLVAN